MRQGGHTAKRARTYLRICVDWHVWDCARGGIELIACETRRCRASATGDTAGGQGGGGWRGGGEMAAIMAPAPGMVIQLMLKQPGIYLWGNHD